MIHDHIHICSFTALITSRKFNKLSNVDDLYSEMNDVKQKAAMISNKIVPRKFIQCSNYLSQNLRVCYISTKIFSSFFE